MRSLREANKVLAKYVPRTGLNRSVYTLDRMIRLMELLDNPQNKYQVIHVAGTSGKTSTCYYIAALLKSSGHKTGLTVSPYVEEVNERVQIDLVPLQENVFCSQLETFIKLIETSGIKPTYFELLVAFAYWYFAKVGVEYAVVEVGLGGTLDGTNVINRNDKVCVITDIGFDHTEILGKTLREITNQKAGIIATGNHVFMNMQSGDVNRVVRHVAKERKAHLHILNRPINYRSLPLFQQRNLSLAEGAVSYLLGQRGTRLANRDLRDAMQISIPGRFEELHIGKKIIILDGAHNPQKISTLYESVHDKYPSNSISTLAAMIDKDKEILRKSLDVIISNSDEYMFTTFHGYQDLPKKPLDLEDFQELMPADKVNFVADYKSALDKILNGKSEVVVITGSLYFIAYIQKYHLENKI